MSDFDCLGIGDSEDPTRGNEIARRDQCVGDRGGQQPGLCGGRSRRLGRDGRGRQREGSWARAARLVCELQRLGSIEGC